jgi:RNA polymerase sigma-70 factor, ECF subfamily
VKSSYGTIRRVEHESQPDELPARDADAVERVARGEADALRELYDRHGGLVHGLALGLLRDRSLAEECTQDVFLALWRQADRYDRRRARVTTWLYTIARNRAVELLRRHAARPAELRAELELGDESPDPADLVGEADRAQQIAEAMAELPEAQLAVLRLAYFDGLTHVEISERLGLPLGTVKGRLRLSLERLRGIVQHRELGVEW